MKQTHPEVEFRRSRTFISVLLAHLLLLTQFTPLFAQTVKVKRATPQTPTPTSTQPIKGGGSKLVNSPTAPAVAGVTATKTDNRTAAQKAGPGDTISYTVVITNNAAGDATGVAFNDTVDANTTLVAGSGVLAADDDYNTIGNVKITVPLAQGLLVNDQDLASGNNTGMTASGGTTSAQGGTIAISSDGSFTYDPPVGFTGTDTFTYTATTSGGKTANATARITVSGKIWFINDAGGACSSNCDGRLSHPFTSLANFQAINDNGVAATHAKTGDNIFIYQSGIAYVGPVTLLNSQKLIGQDSTASLLTITGLTQPSGNDPLPAMDTGGNSSVITSTNANGINLGSGNTIRGLTVTNTGTGTKISGSSFGTLTFANSASPDVTLSGTGKALDLTTGTLAVPAGFVSVASTSSSGQGISLTGVADSDGAGGNSFSFGSTSVSGATTQGILIGTTTADINFGNTTVTAGTDAVSFQNNSSGTRTFGTLMATGGGTGSAFLHGASGGNVTITGAATLSSPGSAVSVNSPGGTNTINFQAATSATSTGSGNAGVNWVGTSGASLSFNTLTIVTNAGTGLNATTGGTVTVTNNTGTINNTTQAAPAVIASAVALNVNFTTVNSSGGSNGISLTNVTGTSNFGSGALSGSSGAEFLVNGSSSAVTYNGTITQTTGAHVVDIQNKTGGTIALGGAITSNNGTGQGIFLNSNTSATINLTGGIALSTGTNDAFTATGGGTVTATQNNTTIVNTLTTTGGVALKVQNTTIGANGLTFRSISAGTGVGSAGDGIILDTTGNSGSLTVTGNGGSCTNSGSCTGGTIQHKTGADASTTAGIGIYLNSTQNVSLTNMQLNDFDNFGIFGNSVAGLTLSGLHVDGSNGNGAVTTNEGAIRFINLTGNALVQNSTISNTNTAGGAVTTFSVSNSSGTLTLLDIENSTISNSNASATGTDALDFTSPTTATSTVMNLKLNGSTFSAARQFLFQLNVQGATTSDVTITSSHFFNNISSVVSAGGGCNLTGGNAGGDIYVHYLISGNAFRVSNGDGVTAGPTNAGRSITIGAASGNSTFDGKFLNNTVGVSGVSRSGAGNASDAVGIFASGNNGSHGDTKVLVQGNTIQQYGEVGVFFNARQGNSVMDATVLGNLIRQPGPAAQGAFGGIWANSGALAGDTNTLNIAIGDAVTTANKNTLTNTDPNNATDVFLENDSAAGAHFNLFKNGSGSSTAAGVITDDNIGPLDLSGFTSGTITLVSGLPTQPTIVLPADGSAAPHRVTTQSVAAPVAQHNDITSHPFIAPPQAVKLAASVAGVKTSSKPEAQAAQPAKSAPPRVLISPQSGTVTANIGTMHAGDSVTINFAVTVNNPVSPLTATSVTNQGTVTGTVNASPFSIQTDDPDVNVSPPDPTSTGLIPAPTININNAKVAEPPSGSTAMAFTVTLSNAYTVPVSVNFQTNDGTALAGQDYTTTSGTLTFPAGVTLQTVSVPILHNAAFTTDRTFTVTLASPMDGILGTSTGTGTITAANPAGTFLISELRTSGPAGAQDEFIELYNNTDSPVTVSTSDASAGWAVARTGATCGDQPVVIVTIPNGTVIPARGHYLVANNTAVTGYSLSNYGGASAAAPDQTYTTDIPADSNVAVFNTGNVANFSSTTRLDAVGFGANTGSTCDLFREGNTATPAQGSASEYSFVRKLTSGTPLDTNDNASDFVIVTTTPTTPVGGNATPTLGAPGPENKTSPIQRNATIKASLIEPTQASTSDTNRHRDTTPNVCNGGVGPSNCTLGTLDIRRRFKNTTGATVTRLRFRVVDMTAGPNGQPGEADMRLLTGSDFAISTSLGSLTVKGTVLEQPPSQPGGGGVNSSVTVALPGGGLTNGATIDVHFLLGVQQGGNYRFFINVEALP
jgi:Calx-beta domain/Bacterial Ig domain/Lamin Tail Domain